MSTTARGRSVARRTFPALGTTGHVLATDEEAAAPAAAITTALLADVDAACSRFLPDPAAVTPAPGRGAPVSPLLTELLAAGLRAARLTGGLVDPTVDGDRFRASAKAWAADRAAAVCAASLPGGFCVNLGGDVAVGGRGPRGGWQVALDDGTTAEAADRPVVSVVAGGLATSSTPAHTRVPAGRESQRVVELHHVVGAGAGGVAEPVWRAVTVSAASAALARAASTAVVVLGRAAPRWLAERGLPARLVSREGLPVYVGDWPEDGPELRWSA